MIDAARGDNGPMLWIKAFHIVFVTSWFAGLFYLPRIFVNLAMVPADSHAERERLPSAWVCGCGWVISGCTSGAGCT